MRTFWKTATNAAKSDAVVPLRATRANSKPTRKVVVDFSRDSAYGPAPFDLWFGMRRSWIGRAMRRVGEPLTHVASTLDGLDTLEFGQGGVCDARDFASFKSAYPLVGVLRTRLSATCQQRVAERFTELIAEDRAYGWATCALIEGVGAARCLTPQRLDSAIVAAGRATAARLERISNGRLTCSSFIDDGFRAACRACWPRLTSATRDSAPIWHPPQSAILLGSSTQPDAPEVADSDSDSLILPGDLWMSPGVTERLVFDNERNEMTTISDRRMSQMSCQFEKTTYEERRSA